MRADVAQQLRPREEAIRIRRRRVGQMAINQRHGLFEVPLLHQARGAIAHDLQIVRALLQQGRPLLGHALVQARRLLQSKQEEADLRVLHVIPGKHLRPSQVFLRNLNPARRRNDFLQLRLNLLKIGRDVHSLGNQWWIHAAFLRLIFSIHTWQRSM
ncbi:hypothetical protein D3C72_1438090 [compost metagenome]